MLMHVVTRSVATFRFQLKFQYNLIEIWLTFQYYDSLLCRGIIWGGLTGEFPQFFFTNVLHKLNSNKAMIKLYIYKNAKIFEFSIYPKLLLWILIKFKIFYCITEISLPKNYQTIESNETSTLSISFYLIVTDLEMSLVHHCSYLLFQLSHQINFLSAKMKLYQIDVSKINFRIEELVRSH